MAGRAVFRKLAGKFGAGAAKTYLYGDAGREAFNNGDFSMGRKMEKIEKFYGHAGSPSQAAAAKYDRILKADALKAKNAKNPDLTFKPARFRVFKNGKYVNYNGFIDSSGQKWVGQPNGGLQKFG